MEANYVSTLGRKLYAQEHYNRFSGDLIDGTLDTFNSNWTQTDDFLTASINQSYHSGQFSVQKRFTGDFGMRMNYTWAKNIDTDSDVFGTTAEDSGSSFIEDRNLDRGLSSLHIPHRFAANWVWDMPFFRQSGNWAARNFLGGWQINGLVAVQSGLPANVNADGSSFTSMIGGVRRGDFNGDGVTDDRPNAPNFTRDDITASDSRFGSIFLPSVRLPMPAWPFLGRRPDCRELWGAIPFNIPPSSQLTFHCSRTSEPPGSDLRIPDCSSVLNSSISSTMSMSTPGKKTFPVHALERPRAHRMRVRFNSL